MTQVLGTKIVTRGITNRGSVRNFKSRQGFQIEAKRLQIGAGISDRGRGYKSVRNNRTILYKIRNIYWEKPMLEFLPKKKIIFLFLLKKIVLRVFPYEV